MQDEEKRLTEKQGESRLLKEEVDEEDIAEVVSRWTGIPVSKLLEGEMQKLLHLEEELHKRVIGQDEAVMAVAEAVIRARSGSKGPRTGPSAASSFSVRPASVRPSWRARWPSFCLMTSTR